HDRGVDVLGEEPQRVRAVHRGIHVLPLLPQDLRLELPDVRLILDYQNARFGHWAAPLDTGMTGLRLPGGPFWCKKCTTIPRNQIRALRDRSHPLLLGSVSARAPWVTRRRATRSAGALQGRAGLGLFDGVRRGDRGIPLGDPGERLEVPVERRHL